jgi:hypothetical protein
MYCPGSYVFFLHFKQVISFTRDETFQPCAGLGKDVRIKKKKKNFHAIAPLISIYFGHKH